MRSNEATAVAVALRSDSEIGTIGRIRSSDEWYAIEVHFKWGKFAEVKHGSGRAFGERRRADVIQKITAAR